MVERPVVDKHSLIQTSEYNTLRMKHLLLQCVSPGNASRKW